MELLHEKLTVPQKQVLLIIIIKMPGGRSFMGAGPTIQVDLALYRGVIYGTCPPGKTKTINLKRLFFY